ncbi:hypothetical protein FPOAC2_11082 [Fusarium poae]|uniref:hypothetical protein n=1 Tax=Fusarium poae TaxID=36050 RepID=UPI001CEBD481|nr:hypothetical protein FPOAC1_010796 [Fusarium poae]KAG8665994.1 hypothetical protein FPOAC1_010796 [Fusarium poae]
MPQFKQPRPVNDDVVQPRSFELPMRNETLDVPGNGPLDVTILLKHADHVIFNADLEGQLNDKDELSGWFRLCLQQRRDTRHMVLPRFTEIHAHCLNDIANHLSSLFAEVRRADKAGEDTSELTEKLVQEALRYDQLLLQTHKIHAIGQPNNIFLRNLVAWNRGILMGDGTGFLDEPTDDWVSIPHQDRLDQFITLIPATKVGRVLAWPFRSNTEMMGDNKLDDYHEGVMKFAIFTVFSLILGIFTCAPAGIQSLNVVSTIGEVAVYVAFVIVFGWLSLGLFRGFERPLLTSLAFAGLMANLLRGNN